MRPPYDACRRILAAHSKSFALAARLFPRRERDRLAAVYAWCREADDAIDLAPAATHAAVLRRLDAELQAIYAGAPQSRPAARAFQAVVASCAIPIAHPRALLDGLAMDARGERYETRADLHRYAFRVAGAVGLMVARVLGVTTRLTGIHAAHLGIAMQITNVCRDVAEDWARGRLYVPAELLPPAIAADLRAALGGPLPPHTHPALARAVAMLLADADRYYRSADRGIRALDWRARIGVRTARLVYAAIGDVLAARGHAIVGARAVVGRGRKLALVARALWAVPRRARSREGGRSRRAAAALRPAIASSIAARLWLATIVATVPAVAAEPPIAPGTYRLELRYATYARLPMIGESGSTYRSMSLVEIARVGGGLEQRHQVCRAETEDAIPLFGLDMPPRFLAALGSQRYPITVAAEADGWRYRADLGREHVGYDPEARDALPASADDPAVFDWDGDGKPGGTIRLRIPIAPDAELYVVQRGHALLDGRVVATDRIEGTVAIPLFEQHVIGAKPAFLHRTPEIRTDTTRSRFVLARLPDGSGCAEVVATRSDP